MRTATRELPDTAKRLLLAISDAGDVVGGDDLPAWMHERRHWPAVEVLTMSGLARAVVRDAGRWRGVRAGDDMAGVHLALTPGGRWAVAELRLDGPGGGRDGTRATTKGTRSPRRRAPRVEPTVAMMRALKAHEAGVDYRSIGLELGTSHETARRYVKCAREFLKAARSVRARPSGGMEQA